MIKGSAGTAPPPPVLANLLPHVASYPPPNGTLVFLYFTYQYKAGMPNVLSMSCILNQADPVSVWY